MKSIILASLVVLTSNFAQASGCDLELKQLRNIAQDAAAIQAQAALDERVPVDRTSAEYKQFNAIGIVTRPEMNGYGTGFLIDACHVLTNNHSVFADPYAAKDGQVINFSVGQNSTPHPPFSHTLVDGKVIAHGNYEGTTESENSDWAIVRLSKPIGNEVGTIPLYQMDVSKMTNKAMVNAGYPAMRTGNGSDLSKLYADVNCKVVGMGLYGQVYHTCQDTQGDSGSPIMTKGSDGKYYAVAMQDSRFDLTRSQDPNVANVGVSFDSGKKDNVISEGDKIVAALNADKCN